MENMEGVLRGDPAAAGPTSRTAVRAEAMRQFLDAGMAFAQAADMAMQQKRQRTIRCLWP